MLPVTPLPSVRTPDHPQARRITWPFLPPDLRTEIGRRCGSPVISAEARDYGFTPGFASVLTCEDGTRHFVKAASTKAQRGSAISYRAEIDVLRRLHPSLPVPALEWLIDDDWVVLCTTYVEGALPQLPWSAPQLTSCLEALEHAAALLTPAPVPATPIADEFAAWPDYWDLVPDRGHHDEATALAARFLEACGGETLVHTDIRPDNLLVDDSGQAWIIDWTWPVEGAAWLDTVTLLALARGDGDATFDADALLAERALTRGVPADDVDSWLALLAGYFLKSALDPVPVAAPHLRRYQQQVGDVVWDWLATRRGWR
jgi:aminoglycoside phosphotransferase (APT) family kinase protein